MTIIPPSAEDNDVDAASLSAHLAKHGIEIGTDMLQIRTVEEHDSLRKQIEQGHYDLLVMGGYSHPLASQVAGIHLRRSHSIHSVLLQTLSRGRGSAKIGSVERGRYDE